MATVIQADRDVAADIAAMIERLAVGGNDVAAIRLGTWDRHGELACLVKAVASHREASTAKLEADLAVAVEALKPFADAVNEAEGAPGAMEIADASYERVTVDHCRAAREALTRIQGEYRSGGGE